jgi:hypothetical protein
MPMESENTIRIYEAMRLDGAKLTSHPMGTAEAIHRDGFEIVWSTALWCSPQSLDERGYLRGTQLDRRPVIT